MEGERVKGILPKKTVGFILAVCILVLMLVPVNALNRKSSSYIFANSSTTALNDSNISNLDYRVLFLARNEIYARHGYTFKTQSLNNYFANKSWYKPKKGYIKQLSEVEKNNVAMLKDYEDCQLSRQTDNSYDNKYRGNRAVFDLNGDGKMDQIEYNVKGWSDSEYELKVNGIAVSGKGEELSDCFNIVDIDINDDLKEIAIEEDGPSDDYKTTFYYYNGKQLVKMGEVYALCGSYRNIEGNGKIKAIQRYDILQTWFYNADFQLLPDHRLKFVEKGLYSSSTVQELEVLKGFAIYKSRDSKEVLKKVRPGEKIRLLGSDLKRWCYIQTQGGIRGWFEVRDYNIVNELGVSAEQVFDGLCNAD